MTDNTQDTGAMTKLVYDAVECFISAKYMDTTDVIDQRWHNAYADECLLYRHLQNMSDVEKDIYRNFVNWLDNTGLYNSDLTMARLYSVFRGCQNLKK